MTGIRKTSKINCLIRLYEKKGLKCDIKKIQKMSLGELTKDITKLRGTRKVKKLLENKTRKRGSSEYDNWFN